MSPKFLAGFARLDAVHQELPIPKTPRALDRWIADGRFIPYIKFQGQKSPRYLHVDSLKQWVRETYPQKDMQDYVRRVCAEIDAIANSNNAG